ncbi:MAG: urease accessory protein UreD [Spongiibacteraceae bacterium]|nr:urease accessory protein UreD [Spongiibacteraceae bacterium]
MLQSLLLTERGGEAQTWKASLALELQGAQSDCSLLGTRLISAKHRGPLYVQKPFYPEGRSHAHLYLLHPPGGLVSGDELSVKIGASQGAGALITTPGAAKIYRARSDTQLQSQKVNLTITERSCLEWFPQETIVYNAAIATMDMQVTLSQDSSYIGWDILCLGLPGAAALFKKGSVNQCLQLFENCGADSNKLIYRDNIDIQASDLLLSSPCGFNQCTVNASLVAKFPVEKIPLIDSLLDTLRKRLDELGAGKQVAVTAMGGICISRYLGESANDAKRLFIELWKMIRPVMIQREASIPRIWYT